MKVIRHIFIALAIVTGLCACVKENLQEITPEELSQDGDKITLDGTLRLPFSQDKGDWVTTKAATMGEETPTVKYLYLAVFSAGDILYEIVKAKPGTQSHPTAEDAGFNCGSESEDYLTPFHVEGLTSVPSGDRYIQFIATTQAIPEFENMEMNLMDEGTFVRTLVTTNAGLAYWGREHYGSITETTNMKGIKMVRNFAKVNVEVDSGVTNFEVVAFKVFNAPVYGTIAPFNTNTDDYQIVNEELQINFNRYADYATAAEETSPYTWLTETNLYYGFMPPVIQYNSLSTYYNSDGTDTMDANNLWIEAGGNDYIYECSYRPEENPFIIIKAKYNGSSTPTYYKADFVYKDTSTGDNVYYNILRNFCYTLHITGVSGKGSSSVFDAVNSIALNNFEGSTMAQELTNIANDNSRLYVSKTDVLLTGGTSFSMYVKSRTGSSFDTNDNASITASIRDATSGSNIVASDSDISIAAADFGSGTYSDWRKVTITVKDAAKLQLGEVWKQPIVFKNGDGLTRTVNLTLRRPMTLTVDMQDVVAGTKNTECELQFSIPAGLTEFRFPMYFYIEQESNTLYPKALADGANEALTVETGTTKIPDNGNINTYYYRRTLTWDEYKNTDTDINGIKTFSCYFKTLVDASATTVWVIPAEANDYYYPFDDIENEYTNKDAFLNNKIAGKVSFPYYGVQLNVGGSVTVAASTNSDSAISYSSSNEAVATVNAAGKVTAVAVGTATITASVEETSSYTAASNSYTVTVTEDALCNLTMNWKYEPVYVIKNGSSVQSPIVETTVASGYTVTVDYTTTSSDGGAVSINETNAETNGYVTTTGTSVGTVTVTATATVKDSGSNVVLTRSLSYDIDVVSLHPESGTIYHSETFMTPSFGDYTVIKEVVTDGATWTEGNSILDLFHQYTTVYNASRQVWFPYYNPSTGRSYGAAASAYGAIEAPTTSIVNGTTVTDYHQQELASICQLASKNIDLSCSAGATVTFYHAGNTFYKRAASGSSPDPDDVAAAQEHMKADCHVYFSSDGGSSWTEQTVKYWPSGAGYVYIKTAIDIPAAYCTSQFRIMFEYTSSSTRAGTWEVENLIIKEN